MVILNAILNAILNIILHLRTVGILAALSFIVFAFHAVNLAAKERAATTDVKFTLLGSRSFDAEVVFAKTRFGGISGIVYDEAEDRLYVVSDDRGGRRPPRFYVMRFAVKSSATGAPFEFDLEIAQVVEVKEKKRKIAVFDFEGIGILPWGNLLLSSEGDDASRPRRLPRLLEVKPFGKPGSKGTTTIVRDFALPAHYEPAKIGKPKQGLRTNLGFEGLAFAPDGRHLNLISEGPLYQDPGLVARILQYDLGEAWVMKPVREWAYPIDQMEGLALLRGPTEILCYEGDRWWVLERGAQLAMSQPLLSSQIYEVEIASGDQEGKLSSQIGDLKKLQKRSVLNLDNENVPHENYEAMAWGPKLPDGRRLLIIASDNNFEKRTPTHFLFYAVEKLSVAVK